MSTFTELIKNRIVLAGLAVMLVSYIFNAPYLALIYGFFLGSLVLVLPKKLNTSVLFRATLSIVLVLTIFQITTILFYAVKVPVDALAIHTVTILVLTLVSYARGIRFSDVKSLTVSVDDLKIIIP